MKKFVAYFVSLLVALFCAAAILSPAVAGAEEVSAVAKTVDFTWIIPAICIAGLVWVKKTFDEIWK